MIRGVPYDAEVEYLESTGTQWIDTGVSISDASLADVTWSVEVVSYNDGCMGAYGSGSYTSMYFNLFSNKFYMRNMRANGGSFTGVSGFNTVRFSGGNSYLNGTAVETEIPLNTRPVRTIYLFAYNRNGTTAGFCKARVSSFIVNENGVLVRDFIPVRFTNEQGVSEGAMYDRVTRRLFRNQGTGAFQWGPDVATPVMGLHMFQRPPLTTLDYVQDGLVAHWDGIENAGRRVHSPNATVWKDLVGTHDITIPTGVGMSWGPNYLHRGLAGLINTGVACVSPNYTVEMVVDVSPDNTPSTNGRLFGSASSSARFEIDIYSQNHTIGPRLFVKRATSSGPSAFTCSFGRESFSGTWCIRYSIDADGFITVSDPSLGKSYRLGNAIDTVYYSGANLLVGSWAVGNSVQAPLVCNIHSIRIYSRALTAAEIAHNYAVDKERFKLP